MRNLQGCMGLGEAVQGYMILAEWRKKRNQTRGCSLLHWCRTVMQKFMIHEVEACCREKIRCIIIDWIAIMCGERYSFDRSIIGYRLREVVMQDRTKNSIVEIIICAVLCNSMYSINVIHSALKSSLKTAKILQLDWTKTIKDWTCSLGLSVLRLEDRKKTGCRGLVLSVKTGLLYPSNYPLKHI